MTSQPKISHSSIAAYIQGRCSGPELKLIKRLCSTHPVGALLLTVLDQLIEKSKPAHSDSSEHPETSRIHEIDGMLARTLSGTITTEEARRLLNAVLLFPDEYNRLNEKLHASTALSPAEEAAELSRASVRSDEDLLRVVRKAACPEPSGSFAVRWIVAIKKSATKLREKISIHPRAIRWAFASTFLLALFVLFIWRPDVFNRRMPVDSVLLSRRLPFPYLQNVMRGLNEPRMSPEEERFIEMFNLGMSDYLMERFESAVSTFEKGDGLANPQFLGRPVRLGLREYYFYWAISNLTLASTRRSGGRETRVREAIRLLSLAGHIAVADSLDGADRESFYFGLALCMRGREEEARNFLETIQPESGYYSDARILIQSLYNPKKEGT